MRLAAAVTIIATLGACVPGVDVEGTPCPCGGSYYCCPTSDTCLPRGDSTCWSPLPLAPPLVLASHRWTLNAEGLAVTGADAVLAAADEGLALFELAEGNQPNLLQLAPEVVPALGVARTETLVAVAQGGGGVALLSVVGRDSLVAASRVAASDRILDVVLRDSILYVSDDRAGVRLYDVSTPTRPVRLAGIASRGVTIREEGVFVSGAKSTLVVGHRLYIADGDGGLHMLDVSEPRAPKHLARFPENRYEVIVDIRAVAMADSLTVLADAQRGMMLVDASDPLRTTVRGTLAGSYHDVAVIDSMACAATGAGWVHLIDLADPGQPILSSAFDTRGTEVTAVAAVGKTCMVTARGGGLHVLSTQLPTADATSGAPAVLAWQRSVNLHEEPQP